MHIAANGSGDLDSEPSRRTHAGTTRSRKLNTERELANPSSVGSRPRTSRTRVWRSRPRAAVRPSGSALPGIAAVAHDVRSALEPSLAVPKAKTSYGLTRAVCASLLIVGIFTALTHSFDTRGRSGSFLSSPAFFYGSRQLIWKEDVVLAMKRAK
jgi:hypothetical protein